MGAGRKTQTIQVSETLPWSSMTGNSSVSAKNLRRSDLGGVIFGCKNNTIAECFSKQLFGLPSLHMSYVKNVEPGLPLFLFNYSNRKLHGIYEAASRGEMNIDPYAWTDDGAERTPFPAQVRIYIKTQCQPLSENEFKKIIEDNYYTLHHFWFELDHAQTRGLLSVFRPSFSANYKLAAVVSKRNSLSTGLPATRWKVTGNTDCAHSEATEQKKNSKSSIDLVNDNKFASLGWDDEDIDPGSSSKTSSNAPEETESKEPVSDWEDWAQDSALVVQSGDGSHLNEENETLQEHQSVNEGSETEVEAVLFKLKKLKLRELCDDHKSLVSVSNGCTDDTAAPCAPGDVQKNNVQPIEKALEEENASPSDIHLGDFEFAQVLKELRKQTAILEKQQAESHREIQQLKDLVKESGKHIEQLKGRVKELESKLDPSIAVVDDSVKKCVEQYLGSENVIYLIGGFDGSSWSSALDSFSPSMDVLTPLKSMSSARSYASAAALDGNIFVFGGGDGCLWYNTVECYYRARDEWTPCPSLICEKGSLAGATLNGKIFAIGGGNGLECFSDVEMFDPALGKWIYSQSMSQKRFAPAAAELHGVLYAVGGYDGKDYLQSAERYDPREPYWTRLPCMKTRRGCHSLAVFNEKIYAIGGYDGERMVSSVEIFDPCLGTWVMDEPMNYVRGYAAAAVLADSLFIIGGVKDGDNIEDTVECYKEGTGWAVSSLKAIGRRCFFSAIVL